MTEDVVFQFLLRLSRSQQGSSLFINGGIGSGKSFLLARLAEAIRKQVYGSIVLGPIKLTSLDPAELGDVILNELDQQGYLDVLPTPNVIADLRAAWQWIADHQNLGKNQQWFVLFDLPEISRDDLELLSQIFSQTRTLEAANPCNASVCQIYAGYWDHPGLEEYYNTIRTSFPYTVGGNYLIWTGVTQSEIATIIHAAGKRQNGLEGRILYELCDGHPGAAREIIRQTTNQQLTVGELLAAVQKAALDSPTARRLVEDWAHLPDDSKDCLPQLLEQKKLLSSLLLPPQLERLRLAGILREHNIGNRAYLGFRSWFVEQVISLNQAKFGIEPVSIPADEIIPPAAEICIEAYRIIHHIEILVRNFVTCELWQRHLDGGKHPLVNKVLQFDEKSKRDEDAYERALDWQVHNRKIGLASADLNPLIAYCSTRDLAALIEEISEENGSKKWQEIANKMNSLAEVRDAVMHNQLIDITDLKRLYDLQADLYAALSVKP